jgi:hypothetical protein
MECRSFTADASAETVLQSIGDMVRGRRHG